MQSETLPLVATQPPPLPLVRRARALSWGGNAWHVLEFAVAVTAGLIAGSPALIGFGADSLIEGLAGFVVLWRLGSASPRAERRAQQLIAASFFLLAAYVAVESVSTLAGGGRPEASWIGIGLAAVTAPTMPLLARAKRRVGGRLGSPAVVPEGVQNGSSSCGRACRRSRSSNRSGMRTPCCGSWPQEAEALERVQAEWARLPPPAAWLAANVGPSAGRD